MQVCVLLPTYNDNVTLLAFDISYRRAHSSKPAAAACGGRMGQTDKRTDGRTDGRTPDSCKDSAPHTMQAVLIMAHYIQQASQASLF